MILIKKKRKEEKENAHSKLFRVEPKESEKNINLNLVYGII